MLPPYVFIVPNKNIPEMGSGFVLGTKPPFYLGRVVKLLPSPFAKTNFINEFNPLIIAEVENYSIYIVFAGNLSRLKVEVYGSNWEHELQIIYDQMAQFFFEEKILNNLGYYKRYKI